MKNSLSRLQENVNANADTNDDAELQLQQPIYF